MYKRKPPQRCFIRSAHCSSQIIRLLAVISAWYELKDVRAKFVATREEEKNLIKPTLEMTFLKHSEGLLGRLGNSNQRDLCLFHGTWNYACLTHRFDTQAELESSLVAAKRHNLQRSPGKCITCVHESTTLIPVPGWKRGNCQLKFLS